MRANIETKTLGFLRRTPNETKRVLRGGERKQESWEEDNDSSSLSLSLPIFFVFLLPLCPVNTIGSREFRKLFFLGWVNFTKVPFMVFEIGLTVGFCHV